MRKAMIGVMALGSVFVAEGYAAKPELQRAIILRVSPDYPELARRMHLEGTVLVEVTALPDGSAGKVHAVNGHPLLTGAAERCVTQWRFVMMSKPVTGVVKVEFSLSPE